MSNTDKPTRYMGRGVLTILDPDTGAVVHGPFECLSLTIEPTTPVIDIVAPRKVDKPAVSDRHRNILRKRF